MILNKIKSVNGVVAFIPWSQRLSFILYWQILRRESLLKFFY